MSTNLLSLLQVILFMLGRVHPHKTVVPERAAQRLTVHSQEALNLNL